MVFGQWLAFPLFNCKVVFSFLSVGKFDTPPLPTRLVLNVQYDPHATLRPEQVFGSMSRGCGTDPGKGPGETQAEALFHANSVALEPVKAQNSSLLISHLQYDGKSLEEQL